MEFIELTLDSSKEKVYIDPFKVSIIAPHTCEGSFIYTNSDSFTVIGKPEYIKKIVENARNVTEY